MPFLAILWINNKKQGIYFFVATDTKLFVKIFLTFFIYILAFFKII